MKLVVKKVTAGKLSSTFLETTQIEGMDHIREIRIKGASISEECQVRWCLTKSSTIESSEER